ncbi:MAG: glycosyltransferase family 39 protein [Myxococcales bacterium]|nr:glycosyltransferase family 39 protein [Myxococcales bacterium]
MGEAGAEAEAEAAEASTSAQESDAGGSVEQVESEGSAAQRLPRWLWLLLVALVILRVGYHSAYLTELPFALATFSDGRLYEQAALDILARPPWGSEPFYLQGLYAYQLALPMTIRPWIAFGLLLQLVLAGLALWGLWRVMVARLGRREAGLGLAVLLAYPGLAFYENKVLTASLAVGTMVLVLVALARLQRRPGPRALLLLGAASGLMILARGNMLLAVPGVAVAAVLAVAPLGRPRRWALAWLVGGLLLSLGPMALRNAIVTGQLTIMPAHGGGTSFYIGNNRHARGVWNDAGGLVSGEVVHERSELVSILGIEERDEAEQAAAIGRALYRRAASEIAEDPGRWLWLELRKAWLLIGHDELTQDYDRAGELEQLPWWAGRGLSFAVLLALGLAGALAMVGRARRDPGLAARWRPWAWVLGSQAAAVVAANLLFFTSSQHRVPLVVPLAVLAGPGLSWLLGGFRESEAGRRGWALAWALVLLVLVQAVWPRQRSDEPTAVHYYNLAVAHLRLGQPDLARGAFDRAVERRPDHPVILLERATLHRLRGRLELARADLDRLEALPELPPWIVARIADERRRVVGLRRMEGIVAQRAQDWSTCAVVFDELLEDPGGTMVDAYDAACCHARIGDRPGALDRLERAAAAGLRDAAHLRADPDLVSLHDEPRWAPIVERVEANRAAAGR